MPIYVHSYISITIPSEFFFYVCKSQVLKLLFEDIANMAHLQLQLVAIVSYCMGKRLTVAIKASSWTNILHD